MALDRKLHGHDDKYYEDGGEYEAIYDADLTYAWESTPYDDYPPYVIGYDAYKMLQIMSVQQIAERFTEDMQERFGVEISPDDVRLVYGSYRD